MPLMRLALPPVLYRDRMASAEAWGRCGAAWATGGAPPVGKNAAWLAGDGPEAGVASNAALLLYERRSCNDNGSHIRAQRENKTAGDTVHYRLLRLVHRYGRGDTEIAKFDLRMVTVLCGRRK